MKETEKKIGLIISIIISAIMGFVASYIATHSGAPQGAEGHIPVVLVYCGNIILSILFGILIARFLPLGMLGGMLCAKARVAPPDIRFFLLNALPISVGNTVIISVILSFIGVVSARMKMPEDLVINLPPLPLMWLGTWVKILVPTLILSYILSVIIAPVMAKIFGVGKPPRDIEN